MGSIERRLADLERRFGPPPDDPVERARLEEKREAFRVRLKRAGEQAEREEAEGSPQRRQALDELEAHMRRRMEERRRYGA